MHENFCYRCIPSNFVAETRRGRDRKGQRKLIITALRHGQGKGRSSFIEAPFDLMYGSRGNSHVVDLLSPFEMLRYWRMERIFPPKEGEKKPTSSWTSAGVTYKTRCKTDKETPQWEAGVHYIALPDADRILLPDLPALSSLRHRCSVELPSNKVHIQFYLPLSPHFENHFYETPIEFPSCLGDLFKFLFQSLFSYLPSLMSSFQNKRKKLSIK